MTECIICNFMCHIILRAWNERFSTPIRECSEDFFASENLLNIAVRDDAVLEELFVFRNINLTCKGWDVLIWGFLIVLEILFVFVDVC